MLGRILILLMLNLYTAGIFAKEVQIETGVLGVDVLHNGQELEIKRNQDRKAKIMKFYQGTWRGKIQPMHPFKPHPVETVAELEVIDYIEKISQGDDSILVVDSRPQSAITITGMIPGAVQITSQMFLSGETQDKMLAILGVEKIADSSHLNFANAKTLVTYCNGFWCGKSPRLIRALLSYGYPAHKIKYYRGGMQAWRSVGLTTVSK